MRDLNPILVAELDRLAPADPPAESRWRELAPRRRLRPTVIGVALCAAAILALAAPWQRGPAALSSADAARVIHRTLAALGAAHGRVLHLRTDVTVASPYHPTTTAWSGTTETWIDESGPQSYRIRTTFPNLPRALETGGEYRGTSPTYVYNSADDTLYSVPLGGGTGFVDPVAQVTQSLRPAPGVTVRKVGDAYRIEDDRNLRRQTVLVVDAKTYRPIREIATLGAGAPFALYPQKPHAPLSEEWQTVTVFRTYQYVREHSLASIRAQHPHANIGHAGDMPKAFKRQFAPWTG